MSTDAIPESLETVTMNTKDASISNYPALAAICAEHTRRIQLLFHEFYNGKVSMQEYRKQSRELTQRLVDEIVVAGYDRQ